MRLQNYSSNAPRSIYGQSIFLSLSILFFLAWTQPIKANYSLESAKEVLAKLYQTIGNRQVKMPGVEIIDTKTDVAAYDPDRNVIMLERKALGICRSFGRDSLDALAFLLGHELTHSFQKVGWATNFLAYDKAYQGDSVKEKLADIQGAFGATLAGFKTREIIAPLITKLYIEYELTDKTLPGYPSMAERQATTNEVSEMVNKLWHIYQSGNYLAVLEYYEMAAKSYEFIQEHYLGREIFNNLGVLYAKQAMSFSGKNIDPYLFPFELDTDSRLAVPRADALSPLEWQNRQQLLSSAKRYLDQALQLDQQYASAHINKLCVQILEKDYAAVIQMQESGRLARVLGAARASPKEKADAEIAVAVAYALSGVNNLGHKTAAGKLLQKLAQNRNVQVQQLAKYNESVLQGSPRGSRILRPCSLPTDKASYPKDVSPFDYLQTKGLYLGDLHQSEIFWKDMEHSTIYVAHWKTNDLPFQEIHSRSYIAPGNVRVGDPIESLTRQLTTDDYQMIPAGRDFFVHFPSCKTIFHVGPQGTIKEWMKYFN